ncbi:MAG TPA: hypothetical protein VF549_17715 [Solirubrobacteraceae bacterium]
MHRILLLVTTVAALAATATPALAGQIVYSTEPADGDAQIRVMNDDGSNDRLLVHEDDIPGAEAVYNPYVSPNGDTVVFQARTPSPGGYGVFCGFRCSGIYAYSGGTITRISQDPTDCPPGDLCLGLDTDPRITGGGSHLFYQMIYGEPGGSYGTPQTISKNYYRTLTPGGGDEVEVPETSCGKGNYVTPNPAVDGEFSSSVYCTGGSYALQIRDMAGGAEETLGYDDAEFANPAFRGDGQVLVGAEDGNDPGLWLYPRDGSTLPHRIAAITWDSDHRPFSTNPTFVGDDEVAFIHGDTIRRLATSCDSCSVDDAQTLATAPGVDAIAWTSQSIPDPLVEQPSDTRGGNQTPAPGPATPKGGMPAPPAKVPANTVPALALDLKAPAKVKLASVLRSGLKVPFVASRAGKLTMRAQIAPALARKLHLARGKAKKPVVVASGTTTVARAGEAAVTLKFTAAAKKRLKRARSVPLTLSGAFDGAALAGRIRLAR